MPHADPPLPLSSDGPSHELIRGRILDTTLGFWREVLGMRGSALLLVLPSCLIFGLAALLVTMIHHRWPIFHMPVGPHEVIGALLGLILVLRTNAGYDRWWEGRRLWGGMVNQTRNLVVSSLSFGLADPAWRDAVARTAAAFPHACRLALRGQRDADAFVPLLGPAEAERLARAQHLPAAVSARLAALLQQAVEAGMSPFAFMQADRERALLLDHQGGCERILKTPIPRSYSMKIRGFIFLYLITLPFAVVAEAGSFTPFLLLLVAYPVLALDQAGIELQNPFRTHNLSHLPLDEICENLSRNLLALPTEISAPDSPAVRT